MRRRDARQGNSSYSGNYQATGKLVDAKLAALGGERLVPRGEGVAWPAGASRAVADQLITRAPARCVSGDSAAGHDVEGEFEVWETQLWNALAAPPTAAAAAAAAAQPTRTIACGAATARSRCTM